MNKGTQYIGMRCELDGMQPQMVPQEKSPGK